MDDKGKIKQVKPKIWNTRVENLMANKKHFSVKLNGLTSEIDNEQYLIWLNQPFKDQGNMKATLDW